MLSWAGFSVEIAVACWIVGVAIVALKGDSFVFAAPYAFVVLS